MILSQPVSDRHRRFGSATGDEPEWFTGLDPAAQRRGAVWLGISQVALEVRRAGRPEHDRARLGLKVLLGVVDETVDRIAELPRHLVGRRLKLIHEAHRRQHNHRGKLGRPYPGPVEPSWKLSQPPCAQQRARDERRGDVVGSLSGTEREKHNDDHDEDRGAAEPSAGLAEGRPATSPIRLA